MLKKPLDERLNRMQNALQFIYLQACLSNNQSKKISTSLSLVYAFTQDNSLKKIHTENTLTILIL